MIAICCYLKLDLISERVSAKATILDLFCLIKKIKVS